MRGPIRGVALIVALSVGAASSHPHAHIVKSAAPKYITIIASAGALGPTPNLETSRFAPPTAVVPKTVVHHVTHPRVVKSHTVTVRRATTPVKPRTYTSADSYAIGEPLWWTWRTDPTAYKPTASDPTHSLPLSAQVTFACIRYVESRNHPNDTNQYSGAEGLYQFLPYIWQYGAKALGIPVMDANYATPEQQSAVAVWFWKRNNGFAPEWQDGCTGE